MCAAIMVRYSSDDWQETIWTGAKKEYPGRMDFSTSLGGAYVLLRFFALPSGFRLEGFFVILRTAFAAARLRRRISSREYIVPRHFFAPQLQMASSSPPS
jgi:hypothetical protein